MSAVSTYPSSSKYWRHSGDSPDSGARVHWFCTDLTIRQLKEECSRCRSLWVKPFESFRWSNWSRCRDSAWWGPPRVRRPSPERQPRPAAKVKRIGQPYRGRCVAQTPRAGSPPWAPIPQGHTGSVQRGTEERPQDVASTQRSPLSPPFLSRQNTQKKEEKALACGAAQCGKRDLADHAQVARQSVVGAAIQTVEKGTLWWPRLP